MKIIEAVVKFVAYDKATGEIIGQCEYGKKLEVTDKEWTERRRVPAVMRQALHDMSLQTDAYTLNGERPCN